MGGFGMAEILLILGILLLLFGAKKIPELMRGMGKGIREFTDAKDAPVTSEKDRVSKTTDPVVPPDTTRDRI
ncbi:MAG: twin-arginine translocase TatA/TatE family subunit [Flavisolibacter sp.]|nr:twin-arginine translocase TatA/TatE family subunit [Flavisolibacter sp.]